MTRAETTEAIIQEGVVAIIRMQDSDKVIRVVEAIRRGGIRAIEITMTVPKALELISAVGDELHGDVLMGVGSVTSVASAEAAIAAGAQYVVSPIFKPEIVAAVHQHDLPVLPGAFTPTEIQSAHECGADIVKVFPADVVGMAFFKAVLAPLPHLRLMPTGGVTLDNAGDWLRAGACAVGVGGALLDKAAIRAGDFDRLTENARRLTEQIQAARA